jgi:anti-sigma regulatory factor (Ser/Thr protein kinase)
LLLSTVDDRRVSLQLETETGPPLGIGDHWEERSSVLPPASVLLLYTDGLVETRTWDIDEGIDLLGALLETLPPGIGPARVLDTALELLPAGSRGDDVAVLAARIPAVSTTATSRVRRMLPAQPRSVPLARSWAEGWLAGSEVPEQARDAARLVISELMTNAISQGEGTVRITLEAADDALLVEVFDTGHRLPSLDDPAADATSGRGLRLVDTLSDEWGVREELEGKTVWARIRW